jgi:tetratricopeptide (TPR) repeat protein
MISFRTYSELLKSFGKSSLAISLLLPVYTSAEEHTENDANQIEEQVEKETSEPVHVVDEKGQEHVLVEHEDANLEQIDIGTDKESSQTTKETESTELIQKFAPNWEQYRTTGIFGDLPTPGKADNSVPFDTSAAESRYIDLLSQDITDEKRKSVMIEMATMFERHNVKTKVAAVYEKYAELFPGDALIPEVYMRLGFIYREMGAFNQSLAKFYSVLNSSLSVDPQKADMYKVISLKAQLEIADTYYSMGDYNEASKFFNRLKRLDLPSEDRALVDFKFAYAQYLLENYSIVISNLKSFINTYPDHNLVPESHFILANAYKNLGQPREAVNETLQLLRVESKNSNSNRTAWLYWKKRTGNQLANEFYEQGDFVSSLRIYQAMAKLSDKPSWQWPVVYQIGLCFERLRMFPKAITAYEHILKDPELPEGETLELDENLKSIRELAQWRLEHLNWLTDTEARLNILLNPSQIGLDDEDEEQE